MEGSLVYSIFMLCWTLLYLAYRSVFLGSWFAIGGKVLSCSNLVLCW